MRKIRRLSSDSLLAKEKEILDRDLISELPDNVLVDIISRLDIREAARTSVLSFRWKCLWTFTSLLNFDTPRKLWCLTKHDEIDEQRSKYISWVNRVLELHGDLNYFNIDFDFDDSHKIIITDWIYKAIAKKVQRLALDFSSQGWRNHLYTFPNEWHDIIKTPHYLSGLRCLTSLSLVRVNITMETLEFFVYNCPLLERLRVEVSRRLSGALKLVGSLIQLKYLEIYRCLLITEVEISAVPSLLSFKFFGGQIKLNIENVPLLVDVSIGRTDYCYEDRVENFMLPVRSYLTQLETLELLLNLRLENISSLCELPKLKHLTFDVVGSKWGSLIHLTDIIKGCPFLYKFTLKFGYIPRGQRRKLHEFPKCSHQHLKVLELIGFGGCLIELEFAFYILENAINLEKIIVDPRSYIRKYSYICLENFESLEFEGRKKAKQLKKRANQGVEFILL